MSVFTSPAIRVLEAQGYRVTRVDDPPDLTEARLVLAAAGWQVFPPLAPPPIGSAWGATRHERTVRELGVHGYAEGATDPDAVRIVTSVVERRVFYRFRDDPTGKIHSLSVAAWHNWRRRMRAQRVF
jgi:hypothetical protein